MKFIISKKNEDLVNALNSGEISRNDIVFIEDIKQIYTQGFYIGGFTDSESVRSTIESIVTSSNTVTEFITNMMKEFTNNVTLSSDGDGLKFLSNDGSYKEIDNQFIKLSTSSQLSFYCIEPVTIVIDNESTEYSANSQVTVFTNNKPFEIITTSDNSIYSLTSFPGPLSEFYPWLNGVKIFSGILFDMNNESMYTKWSQGNQGSYRVQFAQYRNCIFWSDNGYISDVSKRTNYTLFNTSELPLCYSTIPANTFKSFYFAYNVTCDPNWSNQAYKDSFAAATWATQVFSYYGLHSIGIFDMDSSQFNIVLPKDCRGLMFYSPNVLNAGVFDAINTTNFGAKSGSWRDAFGYCSSLRNLYIKNLKVNLNISWSPISQDSLGFILSSAANTNAITIYVSPYTYYSLTENNRQLAIDHNITLSLIETNYADDIRLSKLEFEGDGSSFLSNDGTYKSISFDDNVAYPTLLHDSTEDICTISPNIFHIWDEMSSLDISLGNESPDVTNEYLFQFISGESPTTLILPDTIKWINDFPEIESNKIYQCSIINDIGIICGV